MAVVAKQVDFLFLIALFFYLKLYCKLTDPWNSHNFKNNLQVRYMFRFCYAIALEHSWYWLDYFLSG